MKRKENSDMLNLLTTIAKNMIDCPVSLFNGSDRKEHQYIRVRKTPL